MNFAAKVFLLCRLLSLGFVFSFPLFAERLPIKTYTVADGILRDSVTKIKQDSRGFLWFCTADGLSRFDGYGFTNFRTDEGLPERHANDILETRDGTYFIATDAGIARLNPTGISGSKENPLFTVVLPENPRAQKFSALFEDSAGIIWAGSSDGLFQLSESDNKLKLIPVFLGETNQERIEITTIIEDRQNSLWLGTFGAGLFRLFKNGAVEHFTRQNGLLGENITAIYQDRKGKVWVGTRPDSAGLMRLVENPSPQDKTIVEQTFNDQNGLPASWVTSIYETMDSKFWVGTIAGLCHWQGETNERAVCKTYTATNDLCDSIGSLDEDADGNLWIGSLCGTKKLNRYGFSTFTEADGMANSNVASIFETAGDLYVSVAHNNQIRLSRFDGDGFQTQKVNIPELYSGWGWKQTVRQDTRGDWWIPTGRGLFRFRNIKKFEDLSRSTPEFIRRAAKESEIFRLYEDSRGDIWIATITKSFGLWRWEREADIWHDYTAQVGFSSKRIGTGFAEDFRGNLWIATGSDDDDSALIRHRDGKFRIFTKEEGAPLDWTRDLYVDGKSRLWLANTTVGLLRLDDTDSDKLDFIRYTTAEGLSSTAVSSVTEDKYGRIYAGNGRGLDRLNPETGQIENFTTADGLPHSWVNLAYRDRHDALWFATYKGLARFVPEPVRERKPPKVLITGLRINGIAQSVSILGEMETRNLNLDSDQKQVSIDFVGLGATLGEKLVYEYRLGNSGWTPTTERTVNFANLSTGNYRFEIRAMTADRIFSHTPAAVTFSISAPIWQKWWFIAGIAALAALTIFGFHRYRLQRLLEIERTRTRIATDLHDDIGTNLSKISLLSEIVNMQLSGENEENNRLLSSIAETSRESVTAMSDIVWAINPKRDSLLEMTRRMREHAEEVFVERNVRVRFSAPDDGKNVRLSMDVRRELYLIFKEAVNNASKHSCCDQIEIDFRFESGEIFLRVADNGRGFDLSDSIDGNGLENMKTRAEKINARIKIESNKKSGTEVSVRLPQN